MKLTDKALIFATAATLLLGAGCKKSENVSADTASDKGAIVNAVAAKPWVKEDINALLTYVPANTSLVMATTRQFDMDSPAIKDQLKKAVESFDQSITSSATTLEKKISNPEELAIAKKALDSVKSLRPLIADFEKTAPEWGLNPKGHSDSVIYLDGKTLVMKLTVDDAAKLKAKLDTFLPHLFSTVMMHEMPKPDEIKAGNSTWLAYNLEKFAKEDKSRSFMHGDKPLIYDRMAVHFDKDIVTVAFVNADENAVLEKVLKPAENCLDKSALGKVEKTTQTIGFIDNVKLFEIIKPTVIGELLIASGQRDNATQVAACEKEIGELIATAPKMSLAANILDEGVNTIGMHFQIADKETLKSIQDLTVSHLSLSGDHSLASLAINLDINKTIDWLLSKGKKFMSNSFECDSLNQLIPSSYETPLTTLKDPQFKMFTDAINGISLVLDKLKPTSEDAFDIEAAAIVGGPTVGSTYALVSSFLGTGDPEITKLLNLTKGEVTEKDLTQLAQMPLKINALLSDTDLVLATPTYDVKAISTSERKNDGKLLSFSLDLALLNALGLSKEEVNVSGSYGLAFGTTSDGISLDLRMAP